MTAPSDEPITPDHIKAMLHAGRSNRLAWFASATPQLAETLAAMANAEGGAVLIGVTGDEEPTLQGVDDVEATIEAILSAGLGLTPPLIAPMPKSILMDEKSVVMVDVPAGMPYIYTADGRYLTHQNGQVIPLNTLQLRQLMIERGEVSFETEPACGTSLADLDWGKVAEYARLVRSTDEDVKHLLHKRGCLLKQGESYLPTHAGILLFGKDPTPFIRGAEITAVRFAGQTMSDTFSRQDIGGTLPDQIRRAETFLIDHLRKGVTLKGKMARTEQLEYPMEAAREVVVNAVAHRDYSIDGDGIRLFLFQDRMEVNSPGKLPGPVTLENIKDERFSRNPAIVQVLADMGFIERLGYGVDRMIELMEKNELRAPEFSETGGGFRVKLYNTPLKPLSEQSLPPTAEVTLPSSVVELFHTPLNPRQEAAIAHLNEGNSRITNSELQRMFPDVHAETIRRDLADLVTKDILFKLGQKRGSYYVLKKYAELSTEKS
jgi:ATP-dependent DNA helicase RecG